MEPGPSFSGHPSISKTTGQIQTLKSSNQSLSSIEVLSDVDQAPECGPSHVKVLYYEEYAQVVSTSLQCSH